MGKIPQVTSGTAHLVTTLPGGEFLFVAAQGLVPTSGWSSPRLSPHFYVTPPADGIWGFDFTADKPTGLVLQVVTPVTAAGMFAPPAWLKGVRIHGETNSVDVSIDSGAKTVQSSSAIRAAVASVANVIYRQELASYDDSFGIIGACSPWSARMHKLHHTLTLTVEGPDEGRIRDCVNQATAAGVIAAIVAAYATGGGALQAAVSAFLSYLLQCLGDSYTARVDDRSDWVEWCT